MTYIGVPLIAGGLLVKNKDKHFRSLRNEYLPVFRKRYDDYLQYLPAAVMLGMKAGGVEGRSSWGRMLASDAFSVALMAAAVNSLKTTSKVMRPDGSNSHSFPSGAYGYRLYDRHHVEQRIWWTKSMVQYRGLFSGNCHRIKPDDEQQTLA